MVSETLARTMSILVQHRHGAGAEFKTDNKQKHDHQRHKPCAKTRKNNWALETRTLLVKYQAIMGIILVSWHS